MFKRRKSKWVALGKFTFGNKEYVTFVRKNLKNGMLDFKTKRVNNPLFSMGCVNPFLPANLIDTKKVWDEITG